LPPADHAARLADDAMRASLSQTTLRDLLRDSEPPRAAANG
jgi:DNA-binding IscR family transcriptional regulator